MIELPVKIINRLSICLCWRRLAGSVDLRDTRREFEPCKNTISPNQRKYIGKKKKMHVVKVSSPWLWFCTVGGAEAYIQQTEHLDPYAAACDHWSREKLETIYSKTKDEEIFASIHSQNVSNGMIFTLDRERGGIDDLGISLIRDPAKISKKNLVSIKRKPEFNSNNKKTTRLRKKLNKWSEEG